MSHRIPRAGSAVNRKDLCGPRKNLCDSSVTIPRRLILRVKSAFRPAPLLEALHKAGHRTYVIQPSPEAFHTYVCSKISA